MKKLTTSDFIAKAVAKYGDLFDYSQTVFLGHRTKVVVLCRKHGPYTQLPSNHYKHSGCDACNSEGKAKRYSKSQKEFLEEARQVHGDIFDYSSVEYINWGTKIYIICKIHGPFSQRPGDHLNGKGCRTCARQVPVTDEEYLKRFNEKHGGKYQYPDFKYQGANAKITVVCPTHGPFSLFPYNHLQGNGCYKCKTSRGENCIAFYLDIHGIQYVRQKKFEGCKLKFELPFDFYVQPTLLLEFDGHGHFGPINWGGKLNTATDVTEKAHRLVEIKDKIKDKWAEENGMMLVRISYKECVVSKLNSVLPSVLNFTPRVQDIALSKNDRTRMQQQHDLLQALWLKQSAAPPEPPPSNRKTNYHPPRPNLDHFRPGE